MIKKHNSWAPWWNAVSWKSQPFSFSSVLGKRQRWNVLPLSGVRLSRQLNSHLSETSWCLLSSNQTAFHLFPLEPCLLVSVAVLSSFYQVNCPCWSGFILFTIPTGDICCWRQSTCHVLRNRLCGHGKDEWLVLRNQKCREALRARWCLSYMGSSLSHLHVEMHLGAVWFGRWCWKLVFWLEDRSPNPCLPVYCVHRSNNMFWKPISLWKQQL